MQAFRLATFNLENLDWSGSKPEALRAEATPPMLEALDADICACRKSMRRGFEARRAATDAPMVAGDDQIRELYRATTVGRAATPADVHNLAILSRWPMRA
jgi:hypothetical protein